MSYEILVINPGSTSTKIGVFTDEKLLFDVTLRHSAEELAPYATIADQKDFRKALVLNALKVKEYDAKNLSAVSARGGLVAPIPGGTYAVNDRLLADCAMGVQGQHASNLGALIAHEIGEELGIPAFVVDPPVVDELSDVARFSGHPAIVRASKFHALNQKAVAKRYAKECGKPYEELNLIVCHMGGGVSVGAHDHGKIVDTQNALDGDGPFSPERSGSLPAGQLVELCFSGDYTKAEVKKLLSGRGGVMAYTGTTNMIEVTEKAKVDEYTARVLAAFHYQIAKEIGAMAAALSGKVDQIILTGGIAYGKETVAALREKVEWIAPITVYPGEDELLALTQGALRVLTGEEEAKVY
ncbi:MAG: butyrate kinase [Ruminococcaceae bacterium]|nr:butyrate kinase [Oscillospiraceae bacterium]